MVPAGRRSSPGRRRVDPGRMLRLLVVLLWSVVAAALPAQEQRARVVLQDGRVLEGSVVAIDLGLLHLRVGGEVLALPTAEVESCRFTAAPEDPPADPAGEPPPVEPAAASQEPVPQALAPAATPAGEVAPAAPPAQPAAARAPAGQQPADVAAAPDAAPSDLRRGSRLRQRLDAIDAVYPWLVPEAPTQWISVALLVFLGLSSIVHLSVHVLGAEGASFGRSMALALWYELTGFLQLAMVPSVHVATFSMLIGNTALALFWLRSLFAISRGGAVVALAVQLGFAVLGYGVLELVTSLLASIEPVAT